MLGAWRKNESLSLPYSGVLVKFNSMYNVLVNVDVTNCSWFRAVFFGVGVSCDAQREHPLHSYSS